MRDTKGRVDSTRERSAAREPDESLIIDDRSDLTPAQAVEGRLMNLLRGASLPVSHLQLRGLVRARYEA
ncbi:MAG: hypothetical protein IRY99_09220 [Isosphaeraceae bacterium]|nr:hypothetical protein [Isosphaeraceae bacterium]